MDQYKGYDVLVEDARGAVAYLAGVCLTHDEAVGLARQEWKRMGNADQRRNVVSVVPIRYDDPENDDGVDYDNAETVVDWCRAHTLRLTQEAYRAYDERLGDHYEAHAICEALDEDYAVGWSILDEQLERESQPEYDGGESNACDWSCWSVYLGFCAPSQLMIDSDWIVYDERGRRI